VNDSQVRVDSQTGFAGVGNSSNAKLANVIELVGRVLLAVLFLLSGLGKIGVVSGVPGALLPLVIATGVGGALAIIVAGNTNLEPCFLRVLRCSQQSRFTRNFADQQQMINFLKNV
jgi:putative oxidoreductase